MFKESNYGALDIMNTHTMQLNTYQGWFYLGGGGAQRKLWTDHVAARPVREGGPVHGCAPSRVKRGSKKFICSKHSVQV